MKTRLNLGLLQYSPQQSYNLQKFHTARTKSIHNQLHVACTLGTLAALVFVECKTKALQVRSRFQTAQIA